MIISLGKKRAGLCASREFVCLLFARVSFCPFSLPLGGAGGLAAVCDCGIPGIFYYLLKPKKFLRPEVDINARREAEGTNVDRGLQQTLTTENPWLNVIITHS